MRNKKLTTGTEQKLKTERAHTHKILTTEARLSLAAATAAAHDK